MTAPRNQNVSPKVFELVKRIYAHHEAGCCWHVVLDDGNWDSIDWCRQYARDYSARCKTNGACQELAELAFGPSAAIKAMRKLNST